MQLHPESGDEYDLQEVGLRLRSARAKAGITRRQLALTSNISERYLALLESGSGNPTLDVLASLARPLNLAIAELLPRGGERSNLAARTSERLRRLPPERVAALDEWLNRTETACEKKQRIVLIGLRGAGKSSLGQVLASRISVPFLELSQEVESAYGGPIGLLIELGGKAALHRYEQEVWEAVCKQNDAVVIAVPGGVVADGPLYDSLLASAHSIWLKATPQDHMTRVMAQGDFRPMASNRRAMADLKAILEARSSDYSRADAVVDTSTADFEGAVAELERTVARLLSTRG